MYKFDKIFSITIFILIGTICFFTKFSIEKSILSTLMSFIAIYFGFLLTSISIMINSSEVKKLYSKTDPENNSLNLLERLSNYYKVAIFSCLITIILIIIFLFFKLEKFTFIIPSFIFYILYPTKTLFKILFDVFTNKKVI